MGRGVEYTNKTNKLAIYLPSLGGGGAEKVMVTLANAFAGRGLQVDMVLAQAEGPYLEQVAGDVTIVNLDASGAAASLPGLVRYLRRERPCALLSALNYANVVALLARKLAGVATRVVVSERSVISEEAMIYRGMTHKVVYLLVRLFYPWADGIITVSHSAAHSLSHFAAIPLSAITPIYNPFHLEEMQHLAAQPLSHPWFAPGEPPVVLSAGRLSQQKDQHSLISAFARVRTSRRIRLMLLGEGRLRSALENHARTLGLSDDDIAMPGFVENPFPYMRRAALFALTSRLEGLPGVLVQAMACGTPVVATDCPGGSREILEDGRWGRLVPVGDVETLAAAIEATLDEPVHPNGLQRVRDFSAEQAVDAYLDVLGVRQY